MLDGGSEGGSPQLVQALQAQQKAQQGQGGIPQLSDAHSTAAAGAAGAHSLGQALGSHVSTPTAASHSAPAASHQAPREVTSISEELITRPIQDIGHEVASWFDLNKLFGINTEASPEEKQQRQELFSRYQQLTQEQQQYVQKRLQQEHQRKELMAHEDQQAAAQKQAEASNSPLAAPSGSQKGPVGPAGTGQKSRSQMMTNVVNQNRQSFNKLQNSG